MNHARVRRDLLILPDVLGTGEIAGFVCHDVVTGENFYLDIPKELSKGSVDKKNRQRADVSCYCRRSPEAFLGRADVL